MSELGRRRLTALASAAATLVVIGGVTAAGLLGADDPGDGAGPSPAPKAAPTEGSGPRATASEPTYTWSDEPSPIVLLLPDQNVELKPWTYCWSGPEGADGTSMSMCADGVPGKVSDLVDVGSPGSVEFWFGMPAWDFEATFSKLGGDCPRQYTVHAKATGDLTFRLVPAGPAGRYQVDVFGRGDGGDVITSFVWTTPEAGPVQQPTASGPCTVHR